MGISRAQRLWTVVYAILVCFSATSLWIRDHCISVMRTYLMKREAMSGTGVTQATRVLSWIPDGIRVTWRCHWCDHSTKDQVLCSAVGWGFGVLLVARLPLTTDISRTYEGFASE